MSAPVLKVCGITSVAEAEAIARMPIRYAGLNFIPSSRRCISLQTAEAIASILKRTNISMVALFKDQPLTFAKEIIKKIPINYVQLSSEESIEYVQSLQVPIMHSVAVHPNAFVEDIVQDIEKYPAEYFILDRFMQGQGARVDIDLVRKLVKKYPDKIFLAGGLNPDNLLSTIEQVHLYGIDIASGVRTENQLDVTKVQACLTILSNARPLSN